ncbi:hypothetical protein [Micropruina sp.]|uniref:hypothetical protein n=1 Tax=Micropruina sp. TaxID=2737536 RepID=UPI0039E53EE0
MFEIDSPASGWPSAPVGWHLERQPGHLHIAAAQHHQYPSVEQDERRTLVLATNKTGRASRTPTTTVTSMSNPAARSTPERGRRFSDDGPREPSRPPTRAIAGTRAEPGRVVASKRPVRAVSRLPDLPVRPVPAGQRFGLAAVELVASALAFAAVWALWTIGARSEPTTWLLAGFGVTGAVALLITAAARVRHATQPTARTATVQGRVGAGVQAWPGEHRLEVAIDSALALLCAGVLIADLTAGGRWLPWSLLLLVPAAWFGALSALALTGRRNATAVWLVDDEVLHETVWGREQARLSHCTAVDESDSSVLLSFTQPVRRTVCPRPWRGALPDPTTMRIDARPLGLQPAELAKWLRDATPLVGPVETLAPAEPAETLDVAPHE